MKRDMELIRKLLLELEAGPGFQACEKTIEGYTQDQINYHAGLLIEAHLAEGTGYCKLGDPIPKYELDKLTWAGHEFLDAARDDTRWKRAMKLVEEKGGAVTLGVLQGVLVGLMKSALNLP